MNKSLPDPHLHRQLLSFVATNPELDEVLGLWMVDKGTCKLIHPEEAALFERQFPEI
jgi:hypothetical protein